MATQLKMFFPYFNNHSLTLLDIAIFMEQVLAITGTDVEVILRSENPSCTYLGETWCELNSLTLLPKTTKLQFPYYSATIHSNKMKLIMKKVAYQPPELLLP